MSGSGADAYDSCMCTLVDPESESFVPIEKGFEVEQVPKAIVVSQEKVTRSQWATPAIGAIRLNLIEQVNFTHIGKALLERAGAHKVAEWILCIKFRRKPMRVTANTADHRLFTALDIAP